MEPGVEILERWAAALSARDAGAWAELCSEDCIHEDVAMGVTNHGPDEVRAFGQAFFDAVPDFVVELRSGFGAGPSAVGEWEMSGTHREDLPTMPASGRPFRVRGATLIRLNDAGKVARWTEYWDTAIWLRQLGFLPS
jgi:steroid delta-isomerase-like uncharacterized protein